MTSRGVPPDAPPGQERWLGHWTPSVEAEPLRHTLPAGALHRLQAALPLAANVPTSHVVQSVSPSLAVYLPAGHKVHVAVAAEVDPAGPNFPGEHTVPLHLAVESEGDREIDHVPVKPMRVVPPFDVNVTLTNPVNNVYTLDELR